MRMVNKADKAAAEILTAFEDPNSLPEPLAQVFVHRKDDVPCRRWSWRNQLLVSLRGHHDARGFRQWEAVGRWVKKGESAFHILSPLKVRGEQSSTGEERINICGFRGTAVFGFGQTDGAPLIGHDEHQDWLERLPLREVAASWGLSVAAYNGRSAGALGAYRPSTGIALGVKNLSTWCHELVHAADDRNGTMTRNKVNREVVAELGGAVLLKLLGHDHEADLGGCWAYIRQVAGDEQIEVLSACGKVLDRTCDAVALILDTAAGLRAPGEQGVADASPMAERLGNPIRTVARSRSNPRRRTVNGHGNVDN